MSEQVQNKHTRLVLTGCEEDIQKVEVTLTIQRMAGYGLKRAKDCTDAVLNGKEAVIEGLDHEKLEALAATLRELGVVVRIE